MAGVPKLEPIAPRVWVLRGGMTGTMNAYLIEDTDGVVVYDTGEKGMAPAIAAAAERMGGLKQVVLGHADTDHRGSAPALSARAPVVCHPDAVGEAQGAGGRTYWDMRKLPPAVRVLHGICTAGCGTAGRCRSPAPSAAATRSRASRWSSWPAMRRG